jgi:hypothetical protein
VNVSFSRAELRKQRLLRELENRVLRERYESDLLAFVEAAWPSIDPTEYQPNWAIEALCEHLQAVTEGEIRHLLINFPPRCAKTTVASICYPAWVWARQQSSLRSGAQIRFLCGSYNHELSLANSNKTRRLILSPWYQSLWEKRFVFRQDQNTKTQFDNSLGGSRIATSVSGSLLGIGGDIIIIDDPHNTSEIESDADRAAALNWWKEISTTRLNNPKDTPLIVIMQRLHEEDVSGVILSNEWSSEWCHLMIPMSYNWQRHCVTSIGWQDPRGLDDEGEPLVTIAEDGTREPRDGEAARVLDACENELMWPERFGKTEIDRITADLGPYMASGRLQQMPTPMGGGIFKRMWWQVWDSPDGKFPALEYIIASLDGAFTEKESNSPSALTVWGIFVEPLLQRRRIILLHAWRKFLEFSGPRIEPLVTVTKIDGVEWAPEIPLVGDSERVAKWKRENFRRRTMDKWGLVEWVAYTCDRFKVDKLLIEAKATGMPAAEELTHRYPDRQWSIELQPAWGDKYSRALAVQPTFSQLMVYAPIRDWAEMVIEEMENFPKGKWKDLTDSTSQAHKYLRDTGLANTDKEAVAEEMQRVMHRPKPTALYPV